MTGAEPSPSLEEYMFTLQIRTAIVLTLGIALTTPAFTQVAKQADRPGTTQMCIMSNYIEETPVIDNRIILVRMNPGRGYKRIELATDCSTMADGRNLAFDTRINRLCVQDTLNAREETGHACTISKIVTIDADEAQELMSRRR